MPETSSPSSEASAWEATGNGLVWYAAYGSNLLEERFLAYLYGGPVPGSDLPQNGVANQRPPRQWCRYRLAYRLAFAGRSQRWGGGGVCFVDPSHAIDPPPTYGRAWAIEVDQLAGVWEQENRGNTVRVDLAALERNGYLDADAGPYRRLLFLGRLRGDPVVTITCAELPELRPPSDAYRNVVVTGLADTWGLSELDAKTYLSGQALDRPAEQ